MERKNLIILGGKGLGTTVALIAETELQYNVLGFINEKIPKGDFLLENKKYRVLGSEKTLNFYLQDKNTFCINCYVGMNLSRVSFYEKMTGLNLPQEKTVSIVSNKAVIDPTAKISNGAVIEPYCYIGPQARIEPCARLRAGTYLGHDSTVGKFATVAMRTTIGGGSKIGKAAYVGMGATIRESTSVGAFAKVGMGSVVLKTVPAKTVCFGNPAHKNVTSSQ